jgi:hypothetical protein
VQKRHFFFFITVFLSAHALAETSVEIEVGPGYGLNGNPNSKRYEFQIETEIAEHWDIDAFQRVAKSNGHAKWDQKTEFGIKREWDIAFFRFSVGRNSELGEAYNYYNLMPGAAFKLAPDWTMKLAYRYIHSLPNEAEKSISRTYRTAFEYRLDNKNKLKFKWDHERREMNEFAFGWSYSF